MQCMERLDANQELPQLCRVVAEL